MTKSSKDQGHTLEEDEQGHTANTRGQMQNPLTNVPGGIKRILDMIFALV